MRASHMLLLLVLLAVAMRGVTSKFYTLDSGSDDDDSNDTRSDDESRGREYRRGDLKNYNETDGSGRGGDDDAEKDAQDSIKSKSGCNFTFAGKSGLIKIRDPATNNFLTVKFRSLSDSEGQRATRFEGASWTWTGPTASTCGTLSCLVLTASGNVSVGNKTAQVAVQALMFNETGSYTYGTEQLTVNPSSVKLSYNVTDWPFNVTSGAELYLALTVGSGGKGINKTSTGTGVTVGNGLLNTPTSAYLDGVLTTNVTMKYGTDAEDNKGTQGLVVLVFPQFNSTLYYDPIATATASSTSTTGNSALGLNVNLIAALLMTLLLLVSM